MSIIDLVGNDKFMPVLWWVDWFDQLNGGFIRL